MNQIFEPSEHEQQIWQVWRQDDNGNRFLLQSGLSRSAADDLVDEFERRGHKQHYWVTIDKSHNEEA